MSDSPMPADTAAAVQTISDIMGISGLVHRVDSEHMTPDEITAMLSRRPVAQ